MGADVSRSATGAGTGAGAGIVSGGRPLAVAVMSATLLLACAAAAACVAAAGARSDAWSALAPAPAPDNPWGPWLAARPDGQWTARQSADGRDMEVGVAIGVPNPAPGAAPSAFNFGSPGWTPISGRAAEIQGPIQSFPLSAFPQTPSVQPANIVELNRPVFWGQIMPMPYNPPLSSSYKALPVSEWETSAPRPLAPALVGGGALAPTPFAQRRVGAFRLRSDHGYQLTMEVPPLAVGPGAPADGVLVMEMRSFTVPPSSFKPFASPSARSPAGKRNATPALVSPMTQR
ncbi:Uncharacterized protein GBIM_01972 [Gryllus bimaculatus]|nr:Uncharacterized protein GBIM_01972 [Gryllus bimaculatus]